jgi:hypothetical protein
MITAVPTESQRYREKREVHNIKLVRILNRLVPSKVLIMFIIFYITFVRRCDIYEGTFEGIIYDDKIYV